MQSPIISRLAAVEIAGRFPNDTDLAAIADGLKRAEARLEAAEKLAAYHQSLTEDILDAIAPRADRRASQADRAIDRDLCLIHYCLVVGSPSPFDEWGRSPDRDVAVSQVKVKVFEYLRDRAVAGLKLSPDALAELRYYLDYAIDALTS